MYWALWRYGVGFDIEMMDGPVMLDGEMTYSTGVIIRLPFFEIYIGNEYEPKE